MLTKNDVEILKEIFVTKDEFRNGMDSIIREIRVVIDMIGDQNVRIDKTENKLKNHIKTTLL